MLRARCFFVLASFALTAAPAAGQDAKDAKDTDKLALEGAWALVKFEVGGKQEAGPKPAPWSGEPVAEVKWVRGGKMSTFQRLPKADEVTALRITRGINQTKVLLTAANFPGVLGSLKPVKADDPKYKDWSYADWYFVEFETAEGRFRATLYLGGLGLLSAPNGSVGLVTFEPPK